MNPQFNYRVNYWELIISIKKITILKKKPARITKDH
jgi:hypothetical protein